MYFGRILFFWLAVCGVRGGELLIAKIPSSIGLQDDVIIDQSLLPEILTAALGFTIEEELKWKGMKINNPFEFAEVLVILNVNGVQSLGNFDMLKKFHLNNDENNHVTHQRIINKIIDRYPNGNNSVEVINSNINYESTMTHSDAKILDEILKIDINAGEDGEANVKTPNGLPRFYWFNMEIPHQLSDMKEGQNDSIEQEKYLAYEILLKLSKKFDSAYKGKALVAAIVNDGSHFRKSRSVPKEKFEIPSASFETLNKNIYDPDFPIIFNIILWFNVALLFSLLSVSVFIASMDPGRDSIIYRMTSNRMKKDS